MTRAAAQIARLTSPAECIACRRSIETGSGAWLRPDAPKAPLCTACWNRVARGGRTPAQTIEAILLMNDPDFGGPGDPCDHEDYRDFERLKLWP